MNAKTFERKFDKNSKYVGVIIGAREVAQDGTMIIVTNIIRVSVEPDGVCVYGYGVPSP